MSINYLPGIIGNSGDKDEDSNNHSQSDLPRS